MKLISTPPTRGNSVLDIIATNALDEMVESGVTRPIASAANVESDHRVVYASFKMPRVGNYRVCQYEYKHIDEKGIIAFGGWLDAQEWSQVLSQDSAS